MKRSGAKASFFFLRKIGIGAKIPGPRLKIPGFWLKILGAIALIDRT